MGKNSSIVEFGHLLRRFNMKRGKRAKNKPAALDIVPDTLFVGEFRKGVINSKMASIDPIRVTKARRVGRRAHVLTNLISMESVRTVVQKNEGAYGHINHLGSVGPCRTVMRAKWGNAPMLHIVGWQG